MADLNETEIAPLMASLRLRRRPFLARSWAALAALGALGAGARCARPSGIPVSPRFQRGALSPEMVLPDLTLQRADGGQFGTTDWQGGLALVFFGYTHCPDVCPLTLSRVTQSRRLLAASHTSIGAYFVTVDPARDTPARLREYLATFDPPVVGLTGTDAELATARQAFGVVAEKRPLPGSAADYSIDHTALIYLVDGRAGRSRVRLVYPLGVTPDAIAADVRRLGTTRDDDDNEGKRR